MARQLCIKRNTTAAIPIRINDVSFESLLSVRLVFKSCKHKKEPILLDKTYGLSSNVFSDSSGSGFTLTAIIEPEETFKLKPGDLYIDVYPITTSGVINTGAPLRYEVIDTFCNEVIV